MPVQRSDGFVVQSGDPDGPADGAPRALRPSAPGSTLVSFPSPPWPCRVVGRAASTSRPRAPPGCILAPRVRRPGDWQAPDDPARDHGEGGQEAHVRGDARGVRAIQVSAAASFPTGRCVIYSVRRRAAPSSGLLCCQLTGIRCCSGRTRRCRSTRSGRWRWRAGSLRTTTPAASSSSSSRSPSSPRRVRARAPPPRSTLRCARFLCPGRVRERRVSRARGLRRRDEHPGRALRGVRVRGGGAGGAARRQGERRDQERQGGVGGGQARELDGEEECRRGGRGGGGGRRGGVHRDVRV